MPAVRIDDPPRMNVLGLFLAATLSRNLVEGGRPCALRGALTVNADGMCVSVLFSSEEVVVTREAQDAKVVLRGSLHRFVQALVHRSLRAVLSIRVRGDRLFALRALRVLRP